MFIAPHRKKDNSSVGATLRFLRRRYAAPTELLMSMLARCYKYFVPTGLHVPPNRASQPAVRDQAPLASAFCWKCYKAETCDAEVCDLHKLFHKFCGRGRHQSVEIKNSRRAKSVESSC